MSTLRHTEDFSWNFGEDHGEEAEVLVNDPDEAYNQLMSDAQVAIGRCDYELGLHICEVALGLKQNDVPALYNKAICYANLAKMEKEYRETLNTVLMLEPDHVDARNRLVLLAKNASPSEALQLLPEPTGHEDSETKLFRAIVLVAVKRYKEALSVLATLNSPSFENHFEARLCRARAFRGTGEYEPAFIHASKAVELQPNETALMLRASIVLEYWEHLRRRGAITFGEDIPKRLGPVHARLVANIPNSPGLMILTDSQQIRLGDSLTASRASASSYTSSSSGESLKSTTSNTDALTYTNLLTSLRGKNDTSKMPPMNELLGIALSDLNRAVSLRPNSIQCLSKRGTLHHIMGTYTLAIQDLNAVLHSPALQAAERPLIVLKLTRVLFDAGEHEHLVQAHEILNQQIHISLSLDLLAADVATLLVIGTIPQLWKTETVILSALQAMSEHFVHSLPTRHRGPLMLLVAKINKRISELKEMGSADIETASAMVVQASSTFSPPHSDNGSAEHAKCIEYANQAALNIDDIQLLLRESAFWRQSDESELALLFANQALSIDPSSVSAKLAKAAELYAQGEEQEVLNTLMGLSARNPQVALYRLLASTLSNQQERLTLLDEYLSDLILSDKKFSKTTYEVRMRCWTTAQFNRALILWKIGQRLVARDTLQEILKVVPTHPGALLYSAELCLLDGELNLAIQYFSKRLLQAYSKKPKIFLLMKIATCQQLLGSYGDCLNTVHAVLTLEPTNAAALALQAEATRLNTTIGSALAYTRETVSEVTSYLKKMWWGSKPATGAPTHYDSQHLK